MSVIPNTIPNVGIINYQYQVDPSLPPDTDKSQSNTVITNLSNADLTIVKKVDKQGADLGDVLLYTLVVTNSGNTTANQITIIDTIPQGTQFINDSVSIDNIQKPGVNPQTGINLPFLAAGGTTTITFDVQVTTIPVINPIPNNAAIGYFYTVDPSVVNGKSKHTMSNTVTVPVSHAEVLGVKTVDKKYSTVGEKLLYTLTLSNGGNVPADKVVLYDTIPEDTNYVLDSLTLNGVKLPGVNPQSGVQVGSINPGDKAIITFQVNIPTIPDPNPIVNLGNVYYNYTVQNVGVKAASTITNLVQTKVNDADISIVKSVNKNYVDVNEEITYTLTLTNSGNAKADNLVVYDTIPPSTTFVNNSLTLGGVLQPGVNPQNGVTVGSLNAGASITISYRITVDTVPCITPIIGNCGKVIGNTVASTIPCNNPILNSGCAFYNFIVNEDNGGTKAEAICSNIVQTTVATANLETVKSVSAEYTDVNTEITYTIVFRNTGNTATKNTVFVDTIPPGTVFVENSVTLNGAIQNGANPSAGILIGSVCAYSVETLTFRVRIDSIPNPNPVKNMGFTNYSYQVNPNEQTLTNKQVLTNKVCTKVNHGCLSPIKLVDKGYVAVGETITYTIKVENLGNVLVDEILFIDTIPKYTNFIFGSVIVNNVSKPGANPGTGIPVPALNPSEVAEIKFSVITNTIPDSNPIKNSGIFEYSYTVDPSHVNGVSTTAVTNIVTTTVLEGVIAINKSSNKTYVDLDEELTYTIVLNNVGNTQVNNVTVFDTLPAEMEFIPNSVEIDGAIVPGDNPLAGIFVGSIKATEEVIVTYRVKAIKLPLINPVPNTADVDYTFTTNPTIQNGEHRRKTSNISNVNIDSAIIMNEDGGLIKQVNTSYAAVDDILTYTVILKNTGNVAADKVTLYDPAPAGTVFIPNSLSVDGILKMGVDPTDGFIVGKILPGNSVTIQFKVKVLEIPDPNPIVNIAEVSYIYTSNPANPNERSQRHFSNKVSTVVKEAIISNKDGGLVKAVDKDYGVIGDNLTYTITLKNTGNTKATNIVVKDTVPNNTIFVPGSILVDGVSVSGNPQTGINVADIEPNTQRIVSFKVYVVTLPDPNPIPNNATVQYTFTSNPTFPNANTRKYLSNSVYTQINLAKIDNSDGGFIKKTDAEFAKVNEIITYDFDLTNTGNTKALNVFFVDSIPQGVQFIANSVQINMVNQFGYNPESGFGIGDIEVGETVNVSFKVKVTSLPQINPIQNLAHVVFDYIYNPVTGAIATSNGNSNIITTAINQAYIRNEDGGLVKSVDKSYASVGEVLTYSIKLKNTGNAEATNVKFIDTLPKEVTFVPNSVRVNGIASTANPNTGITVNNLLPQQQALITFEVITNTIPKNNPINNGGKVTYRFTKDPNMPNGEYEEHYSNIVSTTVYEALISNESGGLTKSIDKEYADVGEEVTYAITLINKGNITADNVILFDTIPQGLEFVDDTVTVNGFQVPGQTPETGIVVGNLAVKSTAVITFKCKVVSIPMVNPTVNTADVAYTFVYNPQTQGTRARRNTSNKVMLIVNHAEIANETGGLVKSVDKLYADVDEAITYTIRLTNTGNVNANNVVVIDSIPKGTKFVQHSVTVNGSSVLSANPQTGIFVDTLSPNEVAEVTFKIVAISIPIINPIPNEALVEYSYTVDPANIDGVNANNISNTVYTKINTADLSYESGGILKTGNKAYGDINDIITYQIVLTNKGNVAATNVSLLDTIPKDVKFVENSIVVNGTVLTGVTPGQNIGIGVIGPNEVSTVTFKVQVISIPDDNAVENFATVKYSYTKNPTFPNGQSKTNRSNVFVTTISNATISNEAGGLTKTVSKDYADVDDIITYTFYLENTGNTDAVNVVLKDTIANGTVYIDNSASVNGIIILGANPETGIDVGKIKPGEVVTVSFNVKVIEVPLVNPIKDIGVVSYNYTVDPEVENGKSAVNLSNEESVQINHGEISNEAGGLTKTANKSYVKIGDEITYTITMTNTGNVPTDNVMLQDTIPAGTELLASSILLNSLPILGANPQVGINVGTIKPNGTAVLSFKVLVVSIADNAQVPIIDGLPCMSGKNDSGLIENVAKVCYRYTVDPEKPCGKSKCNLSNVTKTKINTAIISVDKEADKYFVDLGETINFKLKLKNEGNVLGQEIVLTDNLDPALMFVPNSVKINGISQPGINVISGISVAPMQPEDTTTIEFKAVVAKVPSKNEIKNFATVRYSFILNPENGTKGTNTDESNTIVITVNHGMLNGIKTVNTKYASASEELMYTITLTNEGNSRVNNVELLDTVPDGVTLKSGSVIINGVPKPGAVPQYGIFIGTIDPGNKVLISYKVKISDTITLPQITNNAQIDYQYTIDPSNSNEISATTITNTVITNINDAIISNSTGSFVKSASKESVDIGDIFTYTILAKNIGTVSANNVIIKDVLESNLEYVNGTLQINGVPQGDIDLSVGIPVGVIEPQNAVTVSFDVLVKDIVESGVINNVSQIDYSYIKNPIIPIEVQKSELSNDAAVNIISGRISNIFKVSDKKYVKVGDTVKFTITGTNTGNVDLTDVIVTDKLSSSYKFVKDSVTVNGLLRLNESIESGVIIPSLPVNKSFNVSFKALVVSIPSNQEVSNVATVNYSYIVGGSKIKKVGYSNDGIVLVREAKLAIEKLANTEFAQIGDVVSFYLSIKNKGNVTANNVLVEDILPPELRFNVGSIEVNSNPEPIANIVDGVTLEDLKAGEIAIVKFDATVMEIPDSSIILNEAYVKYSFIVDPNKPAISTSSISNEVPITINSTDLIFTKGLNPKYAAIGDIVTFDFEMTNSGNITANNVIFFDTLPKGISFVANSVVVNGIPVPEVDPTLGINIGTIGVDEDIKISFKVSVDSFGKSDTITNIGLLTFMSKVNPNEAQVKGSILSNEVILIIRSPQVTIVKDSNYNTAIVGDIIHYTITTKNTGNIPVENLSVVDLLASNLEFIDGSVLINGNGSPGSNPSKGILIKELESNGVAIVEFDAKIVASNLQFAKNISTAYYNYYVNPDKAPRESKAVSNENIILIENVDITVNKEANKTVVVLDDTITYTVQIANKGTVTATNVEFVDSLPNTVEVIPGTFTVDGVVVNAVDLNGGVNIGSIAPKTTKVIMYTVKVLDIDCSGLVINYAYVLFNANIASDAPVRRVQATPSSLTIRAASPRFKEMNVDKVLAIPCNKPDIEDVNDINISAEVTDFYVIKTIKGVSSDGKRLTGYKLVVNGLLNYSVEYTAAVCSQSVHSSQYCEKFSSYIIIDEASIPSPLANVVTEIEDVSWQKLDARSIFANVTMNVVVK